ncbi:ankyrin repeat domain-containing protein [Histomonas meleagridis]|uniref:ankyrin repeat domain-containing protein n=1 Tax=Histomonas meleagridis TaxID=135588 RepID=UPI00355A6BB8|nr:ankyrin repeat domain-containing protein [Histomonas meleagridis]KAH0802218.1 ankyrin repeat domain-containing protein [Histomonas meleagridis]
MEIVPREVDPNSSIPDRKCDIRNLLSAAAAYGSLECLQFLADNGGDLNCISRNGYTLLHWAAFGGWDDVIYYLIGKNLSVDAADNNKQTALHIACVCGHESTVLLLIENCAHIDHPAMFKWTPLHFAIAYGQKDVCKILLSKGAKIDLKDDLGRNAEVLAHEYKRSWWDSVVSEVKEQLS